MKKDKKIIIPEDILPGCIRQDYLKCGTATCSCQNDPDKRHGPYYRWTGLVDGKSKTLNLSAEEAKEAIQKIKAGAKVTKQIKDLKNKNLKNSPWIKRQKKRK
jgi:hypothetical protein